jgi:putative hydrolase of the HAD superfamily
MLRVALFDLDETLYTPECGLWPAIRDRMTQYMVERLGLPAGEVPTLRTRYFQTYGTTLGGLRAHHGVDEADFLAYVHDLPLSQYLAPSPELNAMLARLPLTKAIFTNADAAHARRVLAELGIAGHFQTIVDVVATGFVFKPSPDSYAYALRVLGVPAEACVLIDDAVRNLQPAGALGMRTVLVTPQPGAPLDHVDAQIPTILHLEACLAPWLPPRRRVEDRHAHR